MIKISHAIGFCIIKCDNIIRISTAREAREKKYGIYSAKSSKMHWKMVIFTKFEDPRFWPEIKPKQTFGDFLAGNKTPKQTFGHLDLKNPKGIYFRSIQHFSSIRHLMTKVSNSSRFDCSCFISLYDRFGRWCTGASKVLEFRSAPINPNRSN